MIKSNKGSNTPGVDGVTIKKIKKMGLSKFLTLIKSQFNYYKPIAVRRKYIPKMIMYFTQNRISYGNIIRLRLLMKTA